jgi:hypothetical protein
VHIAHGVDEVVHMVGGLDGGAMFATGPDMRSLLATLVLDLDGTRADMGSFGGPS